MEWKLRDKIRGNENRQLGKKSSETPMGNEKRPQNRCNEAERKGERDSTTRNEQANETKKEAENGGAQQAYGRKKQQRRAR